MILHQHETAQVGAEVSLGPIRQRRYDRLAIWCDPTLTQVTDRIDRQHKLLDLIGLVALEARSGRHGGLDGPILDDNTRPDLATAWALSLYPGPGRFGGFVHAARLDVRTALQSLQPRDLLTLLGIFPFQLSHLFQQAGHQLFQLGRRQAIKVFRWAHT